MANLTSIYVRHHHHHHHTPNATVESCCESKSNPSSPLFLLFVGSSGKVINPGQLSGLARAPTQLVWADMCGTI